MVERTIGLKYKMTEIGKIPEEWQIKSLTDSCSRITDGSHYSPQETKVGTRLIAAVFNMNNNRINTGTCKRISNKDFDLLVKGGCKPDYGDVLFSKDGTVGICFPYFQQDELVLLSSIAILKPNDFLDSTYLSYFLKSENGMRQVSGIRTGSALKRTTLRDLKSVKILVPLYKEQQKIAKILSDVDDLIESLDALISKKKNIKRGLMQKLLTRGIGHTQFKMTEIGEIPEEWEIKHLDELANVVSGFGFPIRYQERQSGAIPFFKVNDLNASRKVATKSNNYIDEVILRTLKAKAYPKGTIIFPKIGMSVYLNKYRILGVDATFDNNIAGVIPLFINGEFLYYYFAGRIKLKTLSGESAVPSIRKSTLQKLKVPVPSNVEQESISNILTNLDKEIQSLEQKRDKYKLLKTGMMQQLLTGRIRVK